MNSDELVELVARVMGGYRAYRFSDIWGVLPRDAWLKKDAVLLTEDGTYAHNYCRALNTRAAILAVLQGVRESVDRHADNPPDATPNGHDLEWSVGWQDCAMQISAELRDLIAEFTAPPATGADHD